MRALIFNFILIEDQDPVRPPDLGQAVGDQQRRAPFQHPLDGPLDLVLGGAVNGAGRVVQDQDARVGEQRAGDRDPLALAARQRHPALPDAGLIAVGKPGDKVVGLGGFGCRFDGRLIDLLGQAKPDILINRPGKEEDILFNGRDLRAERIELPVAHIDPIDENPSFVHIVGPVDQLGQGRLARSGLADDRDRLPGRRRGRRYSARPAGRRGHCPAEM